MLTTVEVRTTAGTLLTLPLEDAANGLIITDIDGLGPVKATIVSSAFAKRDGTQFQSARREERNITMRIRLEPDYSVDSVQDLRERVYDFFMTKSQVSLRFINSNDLEVDISGRVETCEPAIFSKEPEMNISILCFDIDFVDITPVEISGETTEDLDEITVNYVGNADTGIIFVLNVDRTLDDFTIYHRPPDGVIRTLDFAASLLTGDVVTINTISGSRSVTLTRSGVDSSLLYGISPQSNWLALTKGANYIRVFADGDEIPYEITYTTKYGAL